MFASERGLAVLAAESLSSRERVFGATVLLPAN
jgi:hypothetical protein